MYIRYVITPTHITARESILLIDTHRLPQNSIRISHTSVYFLEFCALFLLVVPGFRASVQAEDFTVRDDVQLKAIYYCTRNVSQPCVHPISTPIGFKELKQQDTWPYVPAWIAEVQGRPPPTPLCVVFAFCPGLASGYWDIPWTLDAQKSMLTGLAYPVKCRGNFKWFLLWLLVFSPWNKVRKAARALEAHIQLNAVETTSGSF
jgi:hypothetical protein